MPMMRCSARSGAGEARLAVGDCEFVEALGLEIVTPRSAEGGAGAERQSGGEARADMVVAGGGVVVEAQAGLEDEAFRGLEARGHESAKVGAGGIEVEELAVRRETVSTPFWTRSLRAEGCSRRWRCCGRLRCRRAGGCGFDFQCPIATQRRGVELAFVAKVQREGTAEAAIAAAIGVEGGRTRGTDSPEEQAEGVASQRAQRVIAGVVAVEFGVVALFDLEGVASVEGVKR